MKKLLVTITFLSIFLSFAQAQSTTYPDEPDLASDSIEVYMTEAEAYFDSIGVEYPLANVYEYLENDNYDSLHAAAEKVLSIFPEDDVARYCRAYATIYRGEWDNVVDDMVFAWENNGMGVDGYQTPLEMLYLIKDYKPVELFGAVSQVEERLTKAQNNRRMLYDADILLGQICGKMGTWGTAAKFYFPKATALADNMEQTTTALKYNASAYLKLGNPEKTLELLNKPLWDTIPETYRYDTKILALRNIGRIDDALNYINARIEEFPDIEEFFMDKGIFLTIQKSYNDAIDSFNKVMELTEVHMKDPFLISELFTLKQQSLTALLRRGIARELKGDQDGANKDYETVADEDQSGGLRLCALARLGRKDEAEEMLKGAYLDELTLAMVYSQLREDDKALDHLGKAFYNQEVAPQAIPYDPNLWRLIDHPRYKEAVAKFDPSK